MSVRTRQPQPPPPVRRSIVHCALHAPFNCACSNVHCALHAPFNAVHAPLCIVHCVLRTPFNSRKRCHTGSANPLAISGWVTFSLAQTQRSISTPATVGCTTFMVSRISVFLGPRIRRRRAGCHGRGRSGRGCFGRVRAPHPPPTPCRGTADRCAALLCSLVNPLRGRRPQS